MDLQKAIDVLGITKENLNIKTIKKAYFKQALQWHPDKNKDCDVSVKFLEIQEAYAFLNEYLNGENVIESDYSFMVSSFIKTVTGIDIDPQQMRLMLEQIKEGYKKTTIILFEGLDRQSSLKLYRYFQQYSFLFGIDAECMDSLTKSMQQKMENYKLIHIEPTLDNLFKDSVYNLVIDSESYCIPLWHDELEFDYDDTRLIVQINPILPSNVFIDDDNSVHITDVVSINHLLDKEFHEIVVGGCLFEINVRELYIKPKQTICFKQKGIAQIDTGDMFSVDKRSDVFIHMEIV
jgi:hypothetical protein